MSIDYLLSLIRDVPDFPKEGIVFKDITPIFQDPQGLRTTIDLFVDRLRHRGVERVIGIESRGFLFGAPVAAELGVGLGLVRKAGKLPYTRVSRSYDLEYGSATLEAHIDMVEPGMKVVILDDLLATGGTALAALELCREVGADVLEIGFLIELGFLTGRSRLEEAGADVFAPIVF